MPASASKATIHAQVILPEITTVSGMSRLASVQFSLDDDSDSVQKTTGGNTDID